MCHDDLRLNDIDVTHFSVLYSEDKHGRYQWNPGVKKHDYVVFTLAVVNRSSVSRGELVHFTHQGIFRCEKLNRY